MENDRINHTLEEKVNSVLLSIMLIQANMFCQSKVIAKKVTSSILFLTISHPLSSAILFIYILYFHAKNCGQMLIGMYIILRTLNISVLPLNATGT